MRFFIWRNDEEHKLGDSPLPDGRVRLFRDNGKEGLSFLAEQQIRYVPIKAEIEINLGPDDLVVYKMRRTSTQRSRFRFDPQPAIFPATPYEAYGCEDPRITFLDGRYYVTYSAVSPRGIAVGLAATDDFRTFERLGVMLPPTQKDVCIFPDRVRGQYVCRHRPCGDGFSAPAIWTAYSPDLVSWGRHEMTLAPTPGTWEGGRVGCGPPPIRTDQGWLEIYHAADEAGRYCLGAMLSDPDRPERILARSSRPVLQPETPYELAGVYGNCVFSCGMVPEDDGRLTIYYGAADSICAAAVTTVDEMVAAAQA